MFITNHSKSAKRMKKMHLVSENFKKRYLSVISDFFFDIVHVCTEHMGGMPIKFILSYEHFSCYFIMKTCPCNVYPLEPHFYVAKLGYAGVYLFFLFLLQNIDCGYSLELPRQGGSNVYPQSMF